MVRSDPLASHPSCAPVAHSRAPSLAGAGDYIPPNGFIYKPDLVWPPPPNPATRLEQVLVGEEELSAQGLDVVVRIDDQVQLYTHNLLLDHPFVSPVNQGSLGGLPPLYIVRRRLPFLSPPAHSLSSPSPLRR